VAFGDLDNDGKIDAVVTALNAPPEIFIHRSPEPNHWLLIRLVGTTSNRDGLGAKIKITTAGGASQYNHATTSTGLSASSDGRVHFGLARHGHPPVSTNWKSPGRAASAKPSPVAADQILTIKETAAVTVSGI